MLHGRYAPTVKSGCIFQQQKVIVRARSSEESARAAEPLADERKKGSVAFRGEILLMVGDEPILVR